MLHFFRKLVVSISNAPGGEHAASEHLNLAAAVLLVEVMMADHEVKEDEIRRIKELLVRLFGIEEDQATRLLDEAVHRHHELVSLHEMTSIVNAQQDQALKRELVFAMWCIALADDHKDKYEEHLIRKVADLLYLSHSDFIKARHRAEELYNN
jgi:uncharacterized tellurite resistance protein B-like protein